MQNIFFSKSFLEKRNFKAEKIHMDHPLDPPPPLWTDMDNLETPLPPYWSPWFMNDPIQQLFKGTIIEIKPTHQILMWRVLLT